MHPFSSIRAALGATAGVALLVLAAGCSSTPPGSSRALATPLDRYVAAPDTNYTWRVVSTVKTNGVTVSAIDLISQSWLTTNEVNRTLWRHWLLVVTPDDVAHSTALLFISGGGNKEGAPPKPGGELVQIARQTRSVVAELKQVPNQPLIFGQDGKERVEDDLIAYTWDKYLRTGDTRWPARLPMTKAAVRAMDTITAHCASPAGGGATVDRFVVAGGSKRGWTTWTSAIVDKRVVAIAPIVIDMLNLVPSFIHHYRAYGFYAPAVQEYVDLGIMDWLGTPEFDRLLKIVEPYQYRDRLTMPKLLINACGDQFFLPDSSQFYFEALPGVKYLRYVPNTDHGLKNSDAWYTLLAWQDALLNRRPLPRFGWKFAADGSIQVTAQDAPKEVRLWQATNPNARDFRLETLGPVWKSTVLADTGGGNYVGQVSRPEKGWTAYLVELTYDLGGPAPLKLTTAVRVEPDVLPFPAPQGRPKR
jgi:PhoPQ-activated pathogenicity-related protein